MHTYLTDTINIPLGKRNEPKRFVAAKCGLRESDIREIKLYKQSVDARKKRDVHFACSFLIDVDKAFVKHAKPFDLPTDIFDQVVPVSGAKDKKIVVVGSGPAGLFCALYLAESGFSVTIVEKGADVDKRQKAVSEFFNGGNFDVDTNVQFGLGGAGTFSDGKLTTGISSPYTYSVFRRFVAFGAPADIMYDSLPHIGTDKLVSVVAAMRDRLLALGCEFLFETTFADIVVGSDSAVRGVVVVDKSGISRELPCSALCLCTGHSARDVFDVLACHHADMSFKSFAVGLRIEHPREYIDFAQYGAAATHRDLHSASYKLVHNGAKHSCYSFCMCPGGVVVAANSEQNSVVVNGMSNYARNAANSNSALVVTVNADDVERYGFGKTVTSGVDFQRYLERRAYNLGGGNYVAPCQSVSDFVNARASLTADGSVYPDVTPSYPRGVRMCDLSDFFPDDITDSIVEALCEFDKKIKGFAHFGMLTAVESRTSSPVRILRDETFQSNLRNLYPVGEGAGYAGGIVSSAVDGLRVAVSICKRFL